MVSTHLCSRLIIAIIDMIFQDVGPGHLQPLQTVNTSALSHHCPPPTNKLHPPLPYTPQEPFLQPLICALDVNLQ